MPEIKIVTEVAGRICALSVEVGATIADAYDKLYYIERAAQVQIYAMWTGQPLKKLPEPVVDKTRQEMRENTFYRGLKPSERHFAALKRILDRKEPDYAT